MNIYFYEKKLKKTNFIDKYKTCKFFGENVIGENCCLVNCYIKNCKIADNVKITNSIIINSKIDSLCEIGSFTHIENSFIGEQCKVKSFVVIENSSILSETFISQLSHIGDANIGNNCHIGCGVIFCEFNGEENFKSKIGDRVFIGNGCKVIAPIIIESDTYITSEINISNSLKKYETIDREFNPYLENFKTKFFGSDGIREIYGEKLTPDLVVKVARSLCYQKATKIMFGTDTRPSGQILANSFINEIKKCGGVLYNLGIVPTACVSFYTSFYKCDYSVIITASHNPKEYNGIKILNNKSIKLSEKEEFNLEKLFNVSEINRSGGKIIDLSKKRNEYYDLIKNFSNFYESKNLKTDEKNLNSNANKLIGLKIVIDCSNGAAFKIAPLIFRDLGADIVAIIGTQGAINENCGCLHPENLIKTVLENKADLGFAFDGDADRVIAVNCKGEILDGDEILYILTWYFKNTNRLSSNCVVGTILTNMGIENKIKALGVKLYRTKIGDNYIIEKMQQDNLELGGEQSGHIIFNRLILSADGVLTARILAHIYKENKKVFLNVKDNKYVQIQKDIILKNPEQKKILKRKEVEDLIAFYKKKLNGGKIIVRASGTEPKIRIIVETTDKNTALFYALELKKKLIKLLTIM
ncbi:MAG: hypothetical protein PHH71_03175 [Clostridia bacterium]|nr:hypothetical protein [Clostridia bacterium]